MVEGRQVVYGLHPMAEHVFTTSRSDVVGVVPFSPPALKGRPTFSRRSAAEKRQTSYTPITIATVVVPEPPMFSVAIFLAPSI